MGQMSYEQASELSNSNFSGTISKIGFLSLKEDGDEAIVRFMHDTTASFDIVAYHTVHVDGRKRKVSCIRDARDTLDKCPLCSNGVTLENRIFIHLIQYTKNDRGEIVAEPKLWERPLRYARILAGLINEYGPLSDCIFKVKRDGEAGSPDTTYPILYVNQQNYPVEKFPKKTEFFDGYKVMGTLVMDKTYEEISSFLLTGSFPSQQRVNQNNHNNQNNQNWTGGYTNQTTTPYPTPQYMPYQQTTTAPPSVNFNQPPNMTPLVEDDGASLAPWETNAPVNRPVRTY